MSDLEPTATPWRQYVLLALQVLVSVGLLSWVLSGVDGDALLVAIAGAAPWLLLAALVILPTHIIANSIRWRYAWPGREHGGGGTRPSLNLLTRLTIVGLFFNQVLPAPIGGDAVRTFGAKRLGCNLSAAALSILIERGWGLIAITLMILPSLPFLFGENLPVGWSPVMIATALTITAVIGLFASFFILLWVSYTVETRLQKPLLVTLLKQGRDTTLRPRPAIVLFLLSVLGQIPPIIAMVLIALALPGELTAMNALMIAPLAMFATVIPLSFAGWGVRETIVVAALACQGVDSSQALALSLVFGLQLLIVSLPGAVLWAGLRKAD